MASWLPERCLDHIKDTFTDVSTGIIFSCSVVCNQGAPRANPDCEEQCPDVLRCLVNHVPTTARPTAAPESRSSGSSYLTSSVVLLTVVIVAVSVVIWRLYVIRHQQRKMTLCRNHQAIELRNKIELPPPASAETSIKECQHSRDTQTSMTSLQTNGSAIATRTPAEYLDGKSRNECTHVNIHANTDDVLSPRWHLLGDVSDDENTIPKGMSTGDGTPYTAKYPRSLICHPVEEHDCRLAIS